ncbi:MAG: metal-dependent hydrolase [Desulfobacterales bacterium]|nr:metal-dependent hydrolase [Desulfobacterales bacterium]
MASFNVHLYSGFICGAGFSTLGISVYHLNPFQGASVFIMATTGALLPDVDSDTGKPLHLMFQLISIMIPSLLLPKVIPLGDNSPEWIISYFTLSYLFLFYGVGTLIKRLTVHRGIFHSIPFSILSAELVYLLFVQSSQKLALIAASAMFSGCILHLLLDEANSFYFKHHLMPSLKRSKGTALKLKSDSIVLTVCIYCLILYVATVIFHLYPIVF